MYQHQIHKLIWIDKETLKWDCVLSLKNASITEQTRYLSLLCKLLCLNPQLGLVISFLSPRSTLSLSLFLVLSQHRNTIKSGWRRLKRVISSILHRTDLLHTSRFVWLKLIDLLFIWSHLQTIYKHLISNFITDNPLKQHDLNEWINNTLKHFWRVDIEKTTPLNTNQPQYKRRRTTTHTGQLINLTLIT